MLSDSLLDRLQEGGVRFCVIGGVAMALRGYVRNTADIDLLTVDPRVLSPSFWAGEGAFEIRRGDFDDPFLGVVRVSLPYPHDLIVGRSALARFAVETSAPVPSVRAPVATPLALLLLKLEAGSRRDLMDALELVSVRRELDGAPWLAELEAHEKLLSAEGRRELVRFRRELAEER